MAGELGVGVKVCRLAHGFAAAPDSLKLHDLVEDWTLLKIRSQSSSNLPNLNRHVLRPNFLTPDAKEHLRQRFGDRVAL